MRPSVVLLPVLPMLLMPAPGGAQESATTVGLVVGWSDTEQIWVPEAEVDRVGGLVIGAWLDAATPAGGLSVVAEGVFTQRGGDVLSVRGSAVEGAVRTDYLSISVRPTAGTGVGAARIHVSAGPALDVILRSRLDAGLATVLIEEGGMVFGVRAGVGLDVAVGGGRRVGVEGRVFEGLSDAYSGNFVSVRNRSWEIVARLGIPMPG